MQITSYLLDPETPRSADARANDGDDSFWVGVFASLDGAEPFASIEPADLRDGQAIFEVQWDREMQRGRSALRVVELRLCDCTDALLEAHGAKRPPLRDPPSFAVFDDASRKAAEALVCASLYDALVSLTREAAEAVAAQMDDDDAGDICGACNGSGEGRYDGSRCSSCRGGGTWRPRGYAVDDDLPY